MAKGSGLEIDKSPRALDALRRLRLERLKLQLDPEKISC